MTPFTVDRLDITGPQTDAVRPYDVTIERVTAAA